MHSSDERDGREGLGMRGRVIRMVVIAGAAIALAAIGTGASTNVGQGADVPVEQPAPEPKAAHADEADRDEAHASPSPSPSQDPEAGPEADHADADESAPASDRRTEDVVDAVTSEVGTLADSEIAGNVSAPECLIDVAVDPVNVCL